MNETPTTYHMWHEWNIYNCTTSCNRWMKTTTHHIMRQVNEATIISLENNCIFYFCFLTNIYHLSLLLYSRFWMSTSSKIVYLHSPGNWEEIFFSGFRTISSVFSMVWVVIVQFLSLPCLILSVVLYPNYKGRLYFHVTAIRQSISNMMYVSVGVWTHI